MPVLLSVFLALLGRNRYSDERRISLKTLGWKISSKALAENLILELATTTHTAIRRIALQR